MKKLDKEVEVLKFIDSSIHKSLDGLEHGLIIHLGGHAIESLRRTTEQSGLIDIITNLVINGDLIQVTREEDTFRNGKIYKNHYYTLTKQGKLRLKPLYSRYPTNLWLFLKSDGYVFLSIISTFLSIISLIVALSYPASQKSNTVTQIKTRVNSIEAVASQSGTQK
jgi:hypothetical protein